MILVSCHSGRDLPIIAIPNWLDIPLVIVVLTGIALHLPLTSLYLVHGGMAVTQAFCQQMPQFDPGVNGINSTLLFVPRVCFVKYV